jgi:hypothetical protein
MLESTSYRIFSPTYALIWSVHCMSICLKVEKTGGSTRLDLIDMNGSATPAIIRLFNKRPISLLI